MNVELRRYLFAHPSTLIFVECARFMCVIFVIKYLIHSIELAIHNCNALCNSLSSLSHVWDFNPHTASDASIYPVFFVPPFRILNVFCWFHYIILNYEMWRRQTRAYKIVAQWDSFLACYSICFQISNIFLEILLCHVELCYIAVLLKI